MHGDHNRGMMVIVQNDCCLIFYSARNLAPVPVFQESRGVHESTQYHDHPVTAPRTDPV